MTLIRYYANVVCLLCGKRVVESGDGNGYLSVPGRPTNLETLIIIRQGPTVLAVDAGGAVLISFYHLPFLSAFSLSLGDGPLYGNF